MSVNIKLASSAGSRIVERRMATFWFQNNQKSVIPCNVPWSSKYRNCE